MRINRLSTNKEAQADQMTTTANQTRSRALPRRKLRSNFSARAKLFRSHLRRGDRLSSPKRSKLIFGKKGRVTNRFVGCKQMKFDVYGRFQLEVVREGDAWQVYRLTPGKRVRAHDIVIPADVLASEAATFLDDLFHELAEPGKSVRLIG